jgi:DNA-binding transcriptional regulator YiaG
MLPPTLKPYTLSIPTADGEKVAYQLELMVPMEWDEIVREWLLTAEAELMIESTKARHMGLLAPEEIRALRENLNLTQAQLSELLLIGAKTWTRWETGRQRPSRSLNILLRALQTGLLTPQSLRQLQESKDWSEAIKAKTEIPEDLNLHLSLETSADCPEFGDMPFAA